MQRIYYCYFIVFNQFNLLSTISYLFAMPMDALSLTPTTLSVVPKSQIASVVL